MKRKVLWTLLVFSIIFVATAVVVIVVLYGGDKKQETKESIDKVHVAKMRQTLEQCRDADSCVGGFIKSKAHKNIFRMSQCIDRGCGFFELGVVRLVNHLIHYDATDEEFNQISFVVLPNNPEWEAMAIAYEKQFLVKPQPPK